MGRPLPQSGRWSPVRRSVRRPRAEQRRFDGSEPVLVHVTSPAAHGRSPSRLLAKLVFEKLAAGIAGQRSRETAKYCGILKSASMNFSRSAATGP